MHEPAALLIAAIRRRLKQLVGIKVREHGLTPAQFWMLNRICEHTGLSLRELAESLYMDQPTASRVVSALVRQKLVRMEDDPEDRRRNRVVPSARGRALGQKLAKFAHDTRAAVEAPLSEAERATFRLLLHKALDHVSAL
jgi:DNA-binding MarR family transcriptional regulator